MSTCRRHNELSNCDELQARVRYAGLHREEETVLYA